MSSALLPLACLFLAGLQLACSAPQPPNVVFISLDTTRRDHLSTYGYERPTTPRLDEFAAGAVVFDRAVAQMTITNPSHACMFTGLYPHSHKVGENTRSLPEENVTLTEVLQAAGYRTGAFVSGHPLRAEITGLDQGFDHYDSDLERRRKGRKTLDRALAWLAGERESGEPFFLFLHFYDAHGPYRPPPEYLERFRSADRGPELDFIPSYQETRDAEGKVYRHAAEYIDRYDAMLRYQDDLVGELLDHLDLDRTVVAVVADHGETLIDRATQLNLNHGTSVFEEQIAIPMLLHAPGLEAQRVAWTAETVDLMPTLLDLVSLPAPPGVSFEGRNLMPRLRGDEPPDRRDFAFASNRARDRNHVDRGYELRRREFIHSVQNERWKLIQYPGVDGDYVELYDLLEDPAETVNLAEQEARIRDGLLTVLETWKGGEIETEPSVDLSPEDIEQLRALGYIQG